MSDDEIQIGLRLRGELAERFDQHRQEIKKMTGEDMQDVRVARGLIRKGLNAISEADDDE